MPYDRTQQGRPDFHSEFAPLVHHNEGSGSLTAVSQKRCCDTSVNDA